MKSAAYLSEMLIRRDCVVHCVGSMMVWRGTGGIMPLNMLRGETVCLCVAWCALCWQQGEGDRSRHLLAGSCQHTDNTRTEEEALSLLKFLKNSIEIFELLSRFEIYLKLSADPNSEETRYAV